MNKVGTNKALACNALYSLEANNVDNEMMVMAMQLRVKLPMVQILKKSAIILTVT